MFFHRGTGYYTQLIAIDLLQDRLTIQESCKDSENRSRGTHTLQVGELTQLLVTAWSTIEVQPVKQPANLGLGDDGSTSVVIPTEMTSKILTSIAPPLPQRCRL